jgi:hypothetical protein
MNRNMQIGIVREYRRVFNDWPEVCAAEDRQMCLREHCELPAQAECCSQSCLPGVQIFAADLSSG